MNKDTLKKAFIVLAAALVLIPSLLTSMINLQFPEVANQGFLSVAILFVMAYVLVDIKDVSKNKAMGKLAACVGLLYALVMQWL